MVHFQLLAFESVTNLQGHIVQSGKVSSPIHHIAPVLGDNQRRSGQVDIIFSESKDLFDGFRVQPRFVRIRQRPGRARLKGG